MDGHEMALVEDYRTYVTECEACGMTPVSFAEFAHTFAEVDED